MEELTHDEIKKAVEYLKENPIEVMWTPENIGVCIAQRVRCDSMVGRTYIMDIWDDGLQTLYSYGVRCVYVQIGREPNTHWLTESGRTYMLWK